MKTLQLISTAIIIGLTSVSFAKDGPKIEKKSSTLTLKILKISSPTCNGGDNGSASVIAEGGKAPYSYDWNTFPNQTTPEATNLTSGTYFVEVTDAAGDVSFQPVYVGEPNSSVIAEKVSKTAELDITATVTGINAPYSFELNGESVKMDLLDNLKTGIHKLVIKDANACEMVQYIQVFEVESTEKAEGSKENKQQIKSKNDRKVEASNLIPTVTIGEIGSKESLVIVSNR